MRDPLVLTLLSVVCLIPSGDASVAQAATSPYARWSRGPSSEPNFFPIGVWLQAPSNAARYRAAGINVYVGLWNGPTDDQLGQLKQAGMQAICSQTAVGLQHLNDPTIIGWIQADEPDNAQPIAGGQYGPPVAPDTIVGIYNRLRAADPNRPVLLNLGQAVAWDNYIGRGVRRNHPEDYPEYVQGCDIASFDIYPVANDDPQVSGKLWLVPTGVQRLKDWVRPRPVWNCIECTHIHSINKATPEQVRCEVWMSLIAGSTGLIYFVHEWQPAYNEAALLSDPMMLAAVTQINQQITALAPVLNSPTIAAGAAVAPVDPNVLIATMVKNYGGAVYLFAVTMREGQTRARFSLPSPSGLQNVEVLGENRTLVSTDGVFEDYFAVWNVHLYRIASTPSSGGSPAALPDTQPPSAPTQLTVKVATPTLVTLVWNPATDNVGVVCYQVYRDGISLGYAITTTFDDTSVTAGVNHTYEVSAWDAAGNESPHSNPLVVVVAGPSVGPSVSSGPLAYWKFDEGHGTVAADASGNGHDGTIVGATWAAGKLGQALDFNGTSSYVQIPADPRLDNLPGLTIAAWIYPRQDKHWHVLDKGDGDKRLYAFGTSSTLDGRVRCSSTHAFSESRSNTVVLNQWQHVAMTWSLATNLVHLYRNGVEVVYATQTPGAGMATDDSVYPVSIGVRGDPAQWAPSDCFNGVLDEIRLYGRALTAQEIQTLYNSPTAP